MTTGSLVRPRAYDILLVEDDAADALLIKDALLERGQHVITRVEDGVEALQRLQDPRFAHPDLIVMDLNMPRMNGHELLAVLKADAALKVIPVVVLSTSDAPDDVTGAYARHANAYVAKPFNLDDFTAAVHNIHTFFFDTASTVPRTEG
ncbi:response regulator [Catenulispora yoronensis]|uniref:Response regulator n=1 Tax=Catenulispora yoronensis TaxID=450799 RepID=A0ABP5F1Q8_9ACTN